ncbi:MAG TPA: DUF2845 domain-containing protein [Cellvibrionaceae bacterium]
MKIVFGCSLFILALSCHADSLRCGAKLIATGDSKGSVEQKCGAPASEDSYCKPIPQLKNSASQSEACTRVDIWHYNRGQGQLAAEVEFQNGAVSAINNGSRE